MSGVHQVLMVGSRSKVLTYIGNTPSTTNAAVYTFSGASIGTASYDRNVHVLVFGHGSGATTITSVTVGGVTAAINGQDSNGFTTLGIVTALVPTGTTGDIVVTFSGTKLRSNIAVFSATGITSTTAVDADESQADPATATLTSVIGGYCLAIAGNENVTSIAWTNVTEINDITIESQCTVSWASATTTATTIAPSANFASSGSDDVGVFATF